MKKLLSFGGCILGAIGLFLPFASVSYLGVSKSVNFIDGDGVIVLITLIVAAVMMFSDKLSKVSLIPLAIGLGITIYDATNVQKIMGTYTISGIDMKLDIGLYMTVAGHIIAGIGALMKGDNVVNQPQFNQFQQPYQQPMYNNYPQQPQTGYQPVQPMNNNMGMPNQNMGMQQPQTGYGQPVQPMNNNMGMPQQQPNGPIQPMNMPNNGVSYSWNNNNNNQSNNF
jgi:hypothetical protein